MGRLYFQESLKFTPDFARQNVIVFGKLMRSPATFPGLLNEHLCGSRRDTVAAEELPDKTGLTAAFEDPPAVVATEADQVRETALAKPGRRLSNSCLAILMSGTTIIQLFVRSYAVLVAEVLVWAVWRTWADSREQLRD